MATLIKRIWTVFGLFIINTVRQTGADLKRLYRLFFRPSGNDQNSNSSSSSSAVRCRVLLILTVLLLLLCAYRYGQRSTIVGDRDIRGPQVYESTWLSHSRLLPPSDNESQLHLNLSGQQMSYRAFLGDGNDSRPMDLDAMLAGDADQQGMPSMQDQNLIILNKIKELEMMEETDTQNMERDAPRPDPNKSAYLESDIEGLMQQHGVKQFLYYHGEQKRIAFTPSRIKIKAPEPREAYETVVKKLASPKMMPTVGNGHLATVVDSPDILMNGLYNGKVSVSHRARIPSMIAFRLSSVNPPQPHERIFSMDFGDGVWRETWKGQDYVVQKTIYVHRFYQRIIVCEVDIFRVKSKTEDQDDLRINMVLQGGSSKDLTFQEGKCGLANCVYIYGKTVDQEIPKSPKLYAHIYYNPLINGITVPAPKDAAERHKYYFYAAIGPDSKEAYNAFKEARKAIEMNTLLSQHVLAWRSLWTHASITVTGNPGMQKAVTSAMYYIYSSMPLRNDTVAPFTGLSPVDLAHGTSVADFRGHVLWDQEMWIMPFLLLFKPYLAKLILFSRARVVDAAYENAKRNHFRGTQFPWESAYTGTEVTPDLRRNHSIYNHHITGDVAYAIQRYAFATKDKSLFADVRYKKVLNGAATFWDSRLEFDKRKNLYVVKSVMPPDEYHWNVNNSAYTNHIAKVSMQAPFRVFEYLDLPSEAFKSVHDKAEQIYQTFDKANLYHPVFETYRIGDKVQQADAILLNYPLQAEMTSIIKRRDLSIYEKVTDKDTAPAQTFAMFCIGFASLKDTEGAHRHMNRTLRHVKAPFGVWTEKKDGQGAVNYISAAGGFLQGLVNGYAGIRVQESYLEINPSLPYGVTEFVMNGLKYQGGSFVVTIQNTSLTIVQIKTAEAIVPFKIRISSNKQEKELIPGRKVVFQRVQVALMQVYGIGRTVHNLKTEVSPRKPSGKGIIEPPKMTEKKSTFDAKSMWNVHKDFKLPTYGAGANQAGKQRDSGLAPPKFDFGENKRKLIGGQAYHAVMPTTTAKPKLEEAQAPVETDMILVPKPPPKPKPKPVVKPAPKPAVKPAPKPVAKPAAKPAPKAPPKAPAPKAPAAKVAVPKPAAKHLSVADKIKNARMRMLSRLGGKA